MNTLNAEGLKKVPSMAQTEPNRTHTLENRESRLERAHKKHESSKVLSVATNDMANVNSYKHLTQVPYMDPNQIKWAINLRTHQ